MVNSGIRVVLANPPTPDGSLVIREGRCEQSGGLWTTVWPPLTLATAAAFLEKQNHTVVIYDSPVQRISAPAFLRKLEEFKPHLVVLNASTPTLEYDLDFSKQIKELLTDTTVIAIGTHVSSLPRDVMENYPSLDSVVIGEPELTILNIADNIASDAAISKIHGTISRLDSRIIENPPRRFLQNLNELPIPAWHLIDIEKYMLPIYKRPFLMISSGRGCPFGCTFCAAQTYYGSHLRLRSPEHILQEMKTVQTKFGVSDFLFWTESFTLAKDQVRNLCDLIISNHLNFNWTCNSRVDVIDEETLKKMKSAGCWMISFGIESASPYVLEKAGKRLHIESIHRAVKLAHKAGLQVTGHFILGLPGESISSLKRTVNLAKRLNVDFAQFYCAVPFPGSKLYKEALRNNWIDKMDWSFFDQTIANMSLPGLNPKDVMAIRNKAIRSFYFRPQNIVRTLSRIRSFNEFGNLIRMFFDFVKNLRVS